MVEKIEQINDKPMPFLDHIAELRKRLFICALFFIIVFIISYNFSSELYVFLSKPLITVLQQEGDKTRLIYTALYEVFFTQVKISLFTALFFTFPLLIVQTWFFIAPGLYVNEKKAILPFLFAAPVFFIIGALFAYYIIFPYAFSFFLSFQKNPKHGLQIEMLASVASYFDIALRLILAFGLTFELPVFLTLLGWIGILPSKTLKKYRRWAWLIIFIIGAILAPPDVLMMMALVVPLLLLFEFSILMIILIEMKTKKSRRGEKNV